MPLNTHTAACRRLLAASGALRVRGRCRVRKPDRASEDLAVEHTQCRPNQSVGLT